MSPCSILIPLTPNKESTWRICVDSITLNKNTIKYRFYLLWINGMMDLFLGSKHFSKFYLISGYY